jgi:O-methyltransferase
VEDKMEVLEIINNLKVNRKCFNSLPLQSDEEFLIIADVIKKCNFLDGDFAEIGAYEGFTSEFISILKEKNKNLFLCDTFEGLADVGIEDNNLNIPNGLLKIDIEVFKNINNFFQNDNIKIIAGYMPDCATKEMDKKIYSFVHIDTDTYLSTLKNLEYFYPKMVNGGIIIVHDYRNHLGCNGVTKAVDIFMIDKPDAFTTYQSTTQAIITKI